jgi:hypothetical protein
MESSSSATCRLSIPHSAQSCLGAPGVSHDRRMTFVSEGDATGLDIATVAFNKNQLAITAGVFVPGSIERMLQLLSDEPTAQLFGPYKASDANVCTTNCRSTTYIHFYLMDSLLGAEVTARQTYEPTVSVLVGAGMATLYAPLVEFLTMVLIHPSATRC